MNDQHPARSTIATSTVVTSTLVTDRRRISITNNLFGLNFPLRLEPCIFGIAKRLAEEYRGGYWQFHTLSNGGFYMAPERDSPFLVMADNGSSGLLSPDAFGIVVCLYTYSGLSFGGDAFAEVCAEHYHWLRNFALDHAEAGGIMAAAD